MKPTTITGIMLALIIIFASMAILLLTGCANSPFQRNRRNWLASQRDWPAQDRAEYAWMLADNKAGYPSKHYVAAP